MATKTKVEVEKEIIETYKSGLSMKETGKKFQVNATTVLNILNRNNIPKRTKGGIYKLPDDIVIQRYLDGESCQVIADDFGVSFKSISLILEKHNIPRNNRYHNLGLDENYFENIDSYDKAYFLGFMLTDGSVALKENIIRLTLTARDEEILQVFKEKTGNSNNLSLRKDEKHNELTFHLRSSKWKKDLAQYHVVPQKTYSCDMPMLSENMMPHLIRGMIDGDGWISYKSPAIGFCGNEKVVTHLRDFLVEKLDVYNVKILQTQEHLWQITWSSKKDISIIGNYIYKDKQDCFLKRKYNNFLLLTQGNIEVSSQIAKG